MYKIARFLMTSLDTDFPFFMRKQSEIYPFRGPQSSETHVFCGKFWTRESEIFWHIESKMLMVANRSYCVDKWSTIAVMAYKALFSAIIIQCIFFCYFLKVLKRLSILLQNRNRRVSQRRGHGVI